MCINKKITTNVISLLVAIIRGSYFANVNGTHTVEARGLIDSFVPAPLLRALAGVCIGVSLYEFIKSVVNCLEKKKDIFTTLISAFGIFCFVVNCYSENAFQSELGFILVFATWLCSKRIIAAILNRRFIKSFKKISLSIYINPALIINVSKYLTKGRENEQIVICIYIVLLMVYSVVFMKVVDFLLLKVKSN